MALVNENYLKLPEYYLFNEIEQKINTFKVLHPDASIIRLGQGDVSRPLPEAVVTAMQNAIVEMSEASTFRGYGPEVGYNFLIDKIIKFDYQSRGVNLSPDEVFISDGSKSDVGNIGHIFGRDNIIAITDPVYPVYENAAIMGGRSGYVTEDAIWSNIVYVPCSEKEGWVPRLPKAKVDIIYLCYPNNPTGIALTKEQLKMWVDYAIENKAIIIYDGAYAAYIREDNIPHSIYEIKGAKKCAIEIRSFSKTAGFTGLRCSYTVVPKDIIGYTMYGECLRVNQLWNRRITTYYNGTSYIVQRGAEAIYSKEGQKQYKEIIDYYLENSAIIRRELSSLGLDVYGGINSPNVWIKTPYKMNSWRFFEELLYDTAVVCIPGDGFGHKGDGFFRFTGFNSRENTEEAMHRFRKWMGQ
ncbi:MAG: LL-diaminopimelate aminotransferase [Paludibacteraceae bacterium]|nr:LL-diaminopimelate aminotransferase [Paludibacteraceae bacterium]